MVAPLIAGIAIAATRYGVKKGVKKLIKKATKKVNKKPTRFVSKQSPLTKKGKKIDRKAQDQFYRDYGEGHDFPEGDFQVYLKKTPGLTKKR